jgi:hypothetical protein
LIGSGHDPNKLFIGYLIGAGAMLLGGMVEIVLGVAAERLNLEAVAKPLLAIRAASTSVRSGTGIAGTHARS